MWFLSLVTFVGSMMLACSSVFPGMLEQIPFGTPGVIAAAVFALFAVLFSLRSMFNPKNPRGLRRSGAPFVTIACVILTPILLMTYTPRREVFKVFQPDFDALLKDAPPPLKHSTVPLNADLKFLWVDHWGTDHRGGVYFRTFAAGQRGGNDRHSYGFAYQPNAEGSPFGDQDYKFHHLTGDWYTFSASDE